MPFILNKPGVEPREIVGVGIVTDEGISLDRAAESMGELRDADGPLTGEALLSKAEDWAIVAGFDIGEPGGPVLTKAQQNAVDAAVTPAVAAPPDPSSSSPSTAPPAQE